MAFDLSTISDILKIDYQGPIRDQLNNSTVLMAWLMKRVKKREFRGKLAYLPLRSGRNTGIGARKEAIGTNDVHKLPSPGNQQYTHAEYNPRYNYANVKWTGPAIFASRDDIGAFVRALESEMQGATTDAKDDHNRQLWHDGSSILTDCGASGPSTSVTVQSTLFLFAGMPISIHTRSTGALITNGNGTVVSITSDTVFVFSASVTVTTAESIIRAGTRDYLGTWGNHVEMWGLEAIDSDANPGNALTDLVGNITRAGSVFWDAQVLKNGGVLRPLQLDLMQQAFDRADFAAGDEGKASIILTNYAINRKYASILQPDKRYAGDGKVVLDGGYSALTFNNVPLTSDKYATLTNTPQKLNQMYFIPTGALELVVMADYQWMNKDGSNLARIAGFDSYEATLFCYKELATDRSNAMALLGDLEETI